MGLRDDYRNYKNYKKNFDPYSKKCPNCGSTNTDWRGDPQATLLSMNKKCFYCKDCDMYAGEMKQR